jgi:vomeronasal1 receptor
VGCGFSQPHCQSNQVWYHTTLSFLIAMMIGGPMFVVFMMWTSLYMVNLLYRHHRRAWHIPSPSFSA